MKIQIGKDTFLIENKENGMAVSRINEAGLKEGLSVLYENYSYDTIDNHGKKIHKSTIVPTDIRAYFENNISIMYLFDSNPLINFDAGIADVIPDPSGKLDSVIINGICYEKSEDLEKYALEAAFFYTKAQEMYKIICQEHEDIIYKNFGKSTKQNFLALKKRDIFNR